jgi:hypothetical protein
MEKGHKVFIGPSALGGLAAYHDVLNLSPYFDALGPLNVHIFFYNFLLQAGATGFVLQDGLMERQEIDRMPRPLQKRITWTQSMAWREIAQGLREIFEGFSASPEEAKGERTSLWGLNAFLSDLIFAAKTGLAIGWVHRTPDPKAIRPLLNDEVYYPVLDFLRSFDNLALSVPNYKSSVERRQVVLLEEILEGQLFLEYGAAHKQLASSLIRPGDAAQSVTRAARNLSLNYDQILRIKRIAAQLLSLSSKAVEVCFGKFPSILSDFFYTHLDTALTEERRVVVYHFSPRFEEVFLDRLSRVFGKEFKFKKPK